MTEKTIILADDHPVFRDGLQALMKHSFPEFRVITKPSLEQAISAARELQSPPQLFILDLYFAQRSIIVDLLSLRGEFNRSAMVVVSMAEDQATIDAVLGYGVNGYIGKATEPEMMIAALQDVLAGQQVVSIPQSANLETQKSSSLSERQMAVLQHIAAGGTNKEIAQALQISPFTVRIHVSALFRSLGVHTRSAAVSKAVAEGILNF